MWMATVSKDVSKPDTAPACEALTLHDVFERMQSELLGALVCLVGNYEDARDALQESFLKCWKHRDQVDEVRNLRAWVFRITLNTGRDIRQTAWRRRRRGLGDSEHELPGNAKDPSATAQYSEETAMLQGAIGQLRDEEQEVFLLRQNGELTYEEIGEQLEIPTGTVKTRMRMALSHLREMLQTDSLEG
jgi:RNA polymerase sigma factor (sigma-70 family)